MNGWFEEIDHTADVEFRIHGETLSDLLGIAAEAMMASIELHLSAEDAVGKQISIKEETRESLLVAWLEELLYLIEVEEIASHPEEMQIEMKGELELEATLAMRKINKVRRHIKAVTFHDLEIQSTENGMETPIVFDI